MSKTDHERAQHEAVASALNEAGYENPSPSLTQWFVESLVEELQKHGWTFTPQEDAKDAQKGVQSPSAYNCGCEPSWAIRDALFPIV